MLLVFIRYMRYFCDVLKIYLYSFYKLSIYLDVMENNGLCFTVKVTPENKRKGELQDELPVILVLAPFNKSPKLQFDNIKLGSSKLQNVIVRNPNVQAIEIQLEKLPPEDSGFKFSDVNFIVEGCQEKLLEIEWTPTEAGKWRYVIQVKGNHRLKLDITITCSCVDPRKGKKSVIPLRSHNSTSSVLTVKTGVKTYSHTRKNVSHGEKKKSPFRSPKRRTTSLLSSRQFSKTITNSDNLNTNDGHNMKNEKFVTIKGNKLPPCTVQSTPTRRETYIVKSIKEDNKENIKQSRMSLKSTKPKNIVTSYLDLEKSKNIVTDYPDTTKSRNIINCPMDLTSKNIQESDVLTVKEFEALNTPARKHSTANRECIMRRETFDSHPGHILERRKQVMINSEKTTPPRMSDRNFKDMLDSLSLTPTSTSVFKLQHFVSPEDKRLPPCTASPASDRRMTYEVQSDSKLENESFYDTEEFLSNSKFENESVLCTEEIIYTARRIKRSVSTHASDSPLTFDDSLDDVLDEKVTETMNYTKKWNEWQRHNCTKSDTSSGTSSDRQSDTSSKTPLIMKTTGLTPQLNQMNFTSEDTELFSTKKWNEWQRHNCTKSDSSSGTSSFKTPLIMKSTGFTPQLNQINFTSEDTKLFSIESPANFSLLLPNDPYRCSTIMKKMDNVSFSSVSPEVRKDLSFADDLETSNDGPGHFDDLSRLSSDTYIKSESSLPDISLCSSDINKQEHLKKQIGTNLELSLLPEENTAKNVIEAGLWVEPTQKGSVPASKTHTDFIHNLETIGEESIEMHLNTFSESTNNVSESQSVKMEKSEVAGTYLEISPPKCQIDMSTSTKEDGKKDSGIKGWSKFSLRTKKSLQPNLHKETASEARNLAGKKRHTDVFQLSEITIKRRVLNDGSVCEGKNTAASMSAKKPLKKSIPRSAIPKLTLSSKKKPKEETVKLHNPDSFLSSLAGPNVFGPTTTSEPFTMSSVYYEEEWLQQQEREFTKWLNSILTPPSELDSTTEIPKVDVAELWAQSCRKQEIELAPTREMVSSQYHTQHRLDALRKAACLLFRSKEIAQVLSKVVVHVDKKLITIRGDRDLHLDFGLKCIVMKLLLNYNPLWLRIALETVYGETIPLESNSDVRGLTKFIMTRLLSDPFILSQYTHPTVLHLYLPGFDEAMKKFTLKKFLLLVYFLDKAKEKRLISHDPCLFYRDAELKNSREILLSFSRDLLSGIGDITKHLKSLGYVVTQNQTYLDEFQYAVSRLGVDLRDGIRLTRVMEIILQNRSLLQELRVPAVSRLQKIHNVSVALSALKNAGYVLTGDITAKDISDGHREKTLSLLWQIIYRFQIPRFGIAASKIQKWWCQQALKLEIERRIKARHMAKLTLAAITIQCSWRKYSAQMKLKTLKEKAEVELKTRQKAAIVIQKNWKMYMNHKIYNQTVISLRKIQTWYRRTRVVKWERTQFLKRRQIFVNFQAHCRGYLYRKRLQCLRRTAAALKIQTWYRRQVTRQKIESLLPFVKKCIEEKQMSNAAITIQRRFKAILHTDLQRKQFLRLKTAAIVIQNRFRAMRLAKYQRQVYMEQKSAAIFIQNKFRATKLMKSEKKKFLQIREAAVYIQRKFRATQLMREQRQKYQLQKSAAITIQNRFRATKLMLAERQHFLQLRNAAIKIQTVFRATLLMRKERQLYLLQRSAAICIQKKFRALKLMQSEQQKFFQFKHAALIIQRKYRALKLMKNQRYKYILERSAAITIQNKFRATMTMKLQRKQFLKIKAAAITIQKKFRATKEMKLQREEFLKLKHVTVTIQRRFRAIKLMGEQIQKYQLQRVAAITIQRKFRAKKEMQLQHKEFLELKNVTIAMQRRFRAIKLMRQERQKYQLQRAAVITIQKKYRAIKEMQSKRRKFLQLKNATITIQRRFRATLLMREERQKYQLQKSAAVIIQNAYRASKLSKNQREKFLRVKQATLIIQRRLKAVILMRQVRKRYLSLRDAAIIIQNKLRATKLMQIQIQQFNDQKLAAVRIQKWYRAIVLRSERQKFLLQRQAAIAVQNKFRAHRSMLIDRQNFLNKKNAAIKIQRKFKAIKLARLQRQEFLKKKSAAVTMQRVFRATLVMRYERQKYLLQKHSAIVIQNKFRAYNLMVSERQNFMKQKNAAIIIQKRFRATMQMREDRLYYKSLKYTVAMVQRKYRAKLVMRKQREFIMRRNLAAKVIQQCFRNYVSRKNNEEMLKISEEEKKRIAAAVRIQALWRGYAVRKSGNLAIEAVRKRALNTIRNAVPDRTLSTRSFNALSTLEKNSAGRLIWAFMELDVITFLSPNLCVQIASTQVIKKIFDHMSAANRSEVYKEMCTVATRVLINLARYRKTVHAVWQVPGNLTTIANIMSAWCGKNDELFCNCCTLLWLFAKDEERAQQMSKDEYLKQRLLYCHKQLKQKQGRPQPLMKGAITPKAKPKTKFTLPSTNPEWCITGVCLQRTFENPWHALTCIIKEMHLKLK